MSGVRRQMSRIHPSSVEVIDNRSYPSVKYHSKNQYARCIITTITLCYNILLYYDTLNELNEAEVKKADKSKNHRPK